MTETVTLNQGGEITVPRDIREQLGLAAGTTFAVFGSEDTLILKKVNQPTAKEAFEKIHKRGVQKAKEERWTEEEWLNKVRQKR